jgi:hypothetical protein
MAEKLSDTAGPLTCALPSAEGAATVKVVQQCLRLLRDGDEWLPDAIGKQHYTITQIWRSIKYLEKLQAWFPAQFSKELSHVLTSLETVHNKFFAEVA